MKILCCVFELVFETVNAPRFYFSVDMQKINMQFVKQNLQHTLNVKQQKNTLAKTVYVSLRLM